MKDKIDHLLQDISYLNPEAKLQLVSKTQTVSKIQKAFDLGHSYFGENKSQELLEKKKTLAHLQITWDFIGHLQTNKVKDLVGNVNLIQSVDRLSLAKEIQKRSKLNHLKQKILVEVNTSREPTKSGVLEEDFSSFIDNVLLLESLDVCGLMTIASNTKDEKEQARCFKKLFNLRLELANKTGKKESNLDLSMGMSNDYKVALNEGATIIRIGSLVFGERL